MRNVKSKRSRHEGCAGQVGIFFFFARIYSKIPSSSLPRHSGRENRRKWSIFAPNCAPDTPTRQQPRILMGTRDRVTSHFRRGIEFSAPSTHGFRRTSGTLKYCYWLDDCPGARSHFEKIQFNLKKHLTEIVTLYIILSTIKYSFPIGNFYIVHLEQYTLMIIGNIIIVTPIEYFSTARICIDFSLGNYAP